MARNGSGTYSLPAGNPVVTGTTISSTWANNTLTDIATAMTGSIAANGETPITANLPMGGFRHTGTGAGVALTDYARLDQAQNSGIQWLSSVTGTDTITAALTPVPAAYAAGQTFRFIPAGANTGAVTLNISSLGAKSITKDGTTALVAGDIPANAVITVTYDGTQFQLITNYAGNASQAFSTAALTTAGLFNISGASAGQIKFPATQNPSADVNTLDDYKEGTGTPTITFATPGDLSVSYSTQTLTYTKIGHRIFVDIAIITSAFTHTTASGEVIITGLPVNASSNNYRSGDIQFSGITAAGYSSFGLRTTSGATTLRINASGSGVGLTTLTAANFPTGGTVQIIGQFSYIP